MLRSGITIGDDPGKQLEDSRWVRKAQTKDVKFDLKHTHEAFMEAKKSFTRPSSLGRKDKLGPKMDPSMVTTFLETCMKLLFDSKVIKVLQELINRCVEIAPSEPQVVRNIHKHKTRMGWEIIMTTQIGEYEMDHVILDLG